jgi:hypothetical protein
MLRIYYMYINIMPTSMVGVMYIVLSSRAADLEFSVESHQIL